MAMVHVVCADSGTVCPAVLSAHTQEELMRRLSDHLKRDHRVRAPNATIMNYMASLAREGEST
jgi:predicted small metal-binding protein